MFFLFILLFNLNFAKTKKEAYHTMQLSDSLSIKWQSSFIFQPIRWPANHTMYANAKTYKDNNLVIHKFDNTKALPLAKIKKLWAEDTKKIATYRFLLNVGCKKINKKIVQCLRKGGNKKWGFVYEMSLWVQKEIYAEMHFKSIKSLKDAEQLMKKFKIVANTKREKT